MNNKNDKPQKNQDFFFHVDTVTEDVGKYTRDKHYHDLSEVYYITHGTCRYFIDDNMYHLSAGDIIFIPKNVIHNTEYDNTIHSRMLINCSDTFIPQAVRPLLSAMPYLYRNHEITEEADMIFNRIRREYRTGDALSKDMILCYTHMLFYTMARNIGITKNPQSTNESVVRAIKYIKQNFSSTVTLSEIAEVCCISPEHLSRTFKKETGLNVNEYINLLRLQKAEALLKRFGSYTISEIATMCGFNDSNYFSLKFKQIYGISPKKMQLGQTHLF